MGLKFKVLVVDTGALVKNVPLWEHGEKLVTVDETINEIKDRQTQQYVAALPVTLHFQQPHPESVKFINEFTKKTGDYHSLSLTDILLLSLTYELEVEAKGADHLRSEPLKRITNTQISVPVSQINDEQSQEVENNKDSNKSNNQKYGNGEMKEGDDNNDDNDDDNNHDNNNDDNGDIWNVVKRSRGKRESSNNTTNQSTEDDTVSVVASATSSVNRNRDKWARDMLPGFYLSPDEDEKIDEEDDEGWLTPENIDQYKNAGDTMSSSSFFDDDDDEQEQEPEVACITSDFAMQNVLLHIGLTVVSVDGKLIRNTRNYVLRCIACYGVTPDMNKLFCPRCGNKTLKRVSMTIDPDGTQHIWISRKPLNTRGLRYNLPKPRGGHHAVMPLLTSDQRFPMQWAKRSKNISALHPDFVAGSSPFSTRDVYSRAAQHGYHSGQNKGINGQLKHAKIWKPKHGKPVKK